MQCKLDIGVLPPSINESYAGFTVKGDTIRFGLTALKKCRGKCNR